MATQCFLQEAIKWIPRNLEATHCDYHGPTGAAPEGSSESETRRNRAQMRRTLTLICSMQYMGFIRPIAAQVFFGVLLGAALRKVSGLLHIVLERFMCLSRIHHYSGMDVQVLCRVCFISVSRSCTFQGTHGQTLQRGLCSYNIIRIWTSRRRIAILFLGRHLEYWGFFGGFSMQLLESATRMLTHRQL